MIAAGSQARNSPAQIGCAVVLFVAIAGAAIVMIRGEMGPRPPRTTLHYMDNPFPPAASPLYQTGFQQGKDMGWRHRQTGSCLPELGALISIAESNAAKDDVSRRGFVDGFRSAFELVK